MESKIFFSWLITPLKKNGREPTWFRRFFGGSDSQIWGAYFWIGLVKTANLIFLFGKTAVENTRWYWENHLTVSFCNWSVFWKRSLRLIGCHSWRTPHWEFLIFCCFDTHVLILTLVRYFWCYSGRRLQGLQLPAPQAMKTLPVHDQRVCNQNLLHLCSWALSPLPPIRMWRAWAGIGR